MKLADLNLKDFVQEVASSSPAPGGGSVAAYAGAQGFALMAMVSRLTIGRQKFASVEDNMKRLMSFASEKLVYLLAQVDEDTEGFKAVMEALALPKQTDAEKSARQEALENATLRAAEIPLQTARLCLEGLREMPDLFKDGNPNAISDMGVAVLMLKSGLDGALYNVQINANSLKGKDHKHSLLLFCKNMGMEGTRLTEEIRAELLAKLI